MKVNEIDTQMILLLAIAIGTGVGIASSQEDIVLGILLAVGLSGLFARATYQ